MTLDPNGQILNFAGFGWAGANSIQINGGGTVVLGSGGDLGSATIVAAGTSLSGAGGVADLTIDGTLSPGAGGAGTIAIAGNLTLDAGSTYTAAITDVGDPSPIVLTGAASSVNLNSATLSVNSTRTTPDPGTVIVLIEGATALTGTFAGLPEGTVVTYDKVNYAITYRYDAVANGGAGAFGTGHDVALVDVSAPPSSLVAPGGTDSSQISGGEVRYGNGDVVLSADDFLGLGTTTRSYSALAAAAGQPLSSGYVGSGWQLSDLPYVVDQDGSLVVTFSPQKAFWFSVSGATYTAEYGALQTLTVDRANSNLLDFTDTDGTVYKFNSLSLSGPVAGQFNESFAPNGATAVVSDYQSSAGAAAGQVETVTYTNPDQTNAYQSISYTYDSNLRVQTATLSHYDISTAQLVPVDQATYTYYDSFDRLRFRGRS